MSEKYIIPNLKRACEILSYLAQNGGKLSREEISKALKFPRTSVLRILETLVDAKYLSYTSDKKYAIGKNFISLVAPLSLRSNIGKIAFPFLKRITEQTGETSHIAVRYSDKVLIVEVCESPLALHAASKSGTLIDTYCSSTGKVLLVELLKKNPEAVKKIKLQKRTKKTITTFEKLREELILTDKRGYALDNEEYHNSIRCMAVPVRDANGKIIASIGLTIPSVRFPDDKIKNFFDILTSASLGLSDRLFSNF